jgi:predicted nucleic acid-binding protein
MSHELFDAALTLYEARPEKESSLTDCAPVLVCEWEGITEVLAHDQHFVQAGLIALLRED